MFKQGDRVKLNTEATARRFFVLSVDGTHVRLVSTSDNAGYLVNSDNVTETHPCYLEIDPKPTKARLISKWIQFEASRG